MAVYTLDISDDYITEIEADNDKDAREQADRVARCHGPLIEVLLYRGPMISGGYPIYAARTDGRGNLR